MDINGIRLENYKRLLAEFQQRPDQAGLLNHGLIKRFAEHTGLSAKYLSHINNDRKNIGEAVARQMEAAFNKVHGWLDNLHDATLESAIQPEKELITTVLGLFRESPIEVQNLLMRYMREKIEAKKP